jgi:hypothetical protein
MYENTGENAESLVGQESNPKLDVAGSSPVARSLFFAWLTALTICPPATLRNPAQTGQPLQSVPLGGGQMARLFRGGA